MIKQEGRRKRKARRIADCFTAEGRCRLRADKEIMKRFSKITGESVVLTKKNRSMLFPWSIAKLKYVLERPVASLEIGYMEILDVEIPRQKFDKLMLQCNAYERLAKMDYPKRNGKNP